MGGQGDIIGLCHSGDLLHLGDASGVGQVGLDDIHPSRLEEPLEVVAGEQALAGGDGHVAGSGNLLKVLHVLTQDGLLQKHGVELLQLLGQNLGHGLVHPAMEVHRDAEVFAHRLPDGGTRSSTSSIFS